MWTSSTGSSAIGSTATPSTSRGAIAVGSPVVSHTVHLLIGRRLSLRRLRGETHAHVAAGSQPGDAFASSSHHVLTNGAPRGRSAGRRRSMSTLRNHAGTSGTSSKLVTKYSRPPGSV